MDRTKLDRYRQLLLAKRRQFLPAAPPIWRTANRSEASVGDFANQAAEEVQTGLQVRYTRARAVCCEPSKMHWLESSWAPSVFVRRASAPFPRRG